MMGVCVVEGEKCWIDPVFRCGQRVDPVQRKESGLGRTFYTQNPWPAVRNSGHAVRMNHLRNHVGGAGKRNDASWINRLLFDVFSIASSFHDPM